jgi:hypothetical protein
MENHVPRCRVTWYGGVRLYVDLFLPPNLFDVNTIIWCI